MTLIFEQIVDHVRNLPLDQQEMLRDLIDKWQIERRRREIAEDAQTSLALFREGNLSAHSAKTVIDTLQQSLSQPE
ncbi:MAG: hypothetical protein AB4911_23250 [Oscillochloridaceae bacterium umkhey_bin13]